MFLIALFVAHLIAAATGATTNQFINPGPQNFNLQQVDGTYPIGSAINIQWETIYNTVTLVIWQNGPLTFQYLPNSCKRFASIYS
jgi:hypothetical protein